MSIQYGVAAVLVSGELAESNYARIDDPATQRLIDMMTLEIDESFTKGVPAAAGLFGCDPPQGAAATRQPLAAGCRAGNAGRSPHARARGDGVAARRSCARHKCWRRSPRSRSPRMSTR